MTEEEKAALAAKEAEEKAKSDVVVETDPLAEKDAEIAKLKEERDNYKTVALKRLGKLDGDASFLSNGNEDTSELSVAEQIRLALLDKEISDAEKKKEEEYKRAMKEISELKLALKNRPETSMGGESGAPLESKDAVFTNEQIDELKRRAIKLKVDPDKFVENAKKNLAARK